MKMAKINKLKYLIPIKNCLVNKSTVAILSDTYQYDFNHFLNCQHDKNAPIELFTQLCYALEELFKLGYVHRSVCPEKVRITYDPLAVHLAGYSTATLSTTLLQTQISRPTLFTDNWRNINDGSQLHDVYSVAMLIFRYEIQNDIWQQTNTQRDIG
jgi:hypothetical protein